VEPGLSATELPGVTTLIELGMPDKNPVGQLGVGPAVGVLQIPENVIVPKIAFD
jgi:hypothetical protein